MRLPFKRRKDPAPIVLHTDIKLDGRLLRRETVRYIIKRRRAD